MNELTLSPAFQRGKRRINFISPERAIDCESGEVDMKESDFGKILECRSVILVKLGGNLARFTRWAVATIVPPCAGKGQEPFNMEAPAL